jgi:peptide/nickel transport system substrate-binding protein
MPVVDLPLWHLLVFNHRAGIMTDRRIRQAVQAALDHEAIMRAAIGPTRFWRLDPGLVVREHPMWTDAGKEMYNQRNPTRAAQLLREAGYAGQPVRILSSMEFPTSGIAAQVVKSQLERAGFVVDLQMVDWATVLARRDRPELWDMFTTAMPFIYTVDPVLLLPLQPTWPGWYNNRDMNAMMMLMRRHGDPRVRYEIWKRMQQLWYEDAAGIKLGDAFDIHLARRELQGVTHAPYPVFWNSWLERR